MNLSESPRGSSYISSQSKIYVSARSFSSMHLLKSSQRFNLCYHYQTPFGSSLFVGTAKVRIFSILSRVFLSFFSFLSKTKNKTPQHCSLPHNLSMYSPLILHNLAPLAGCKSRKNYNHTKLFIHLICITKLKP